MKAEIINGELLLERDGMCKTVICPHSGKYCGPRCALFGEAERIVPDWNNPTHYKYELQLCSKTLLLTHFKITTTTE